VRPGQLVLDVGAGIGGPSRVLARHYQAIVAATADTERMAPGLPGVGLDLLMPDYTARMAGLASNVEAGRVSLLLAVMTTEDTPTILSKRSNRHRTLKQKGT
jgi:hypothetical protein